MASPTQTNRLDEHADPGAAAALAGDCDPTLFAGKFRVERLLGAGGMGCVFAARHVLLDQPVAIKVMKGERLLDPAARARFLREGRAAATIRSEHVARVFDAAMLPTGEPYLVLECLEGQDVARALAERGRFTIEEAVDVLLQTCDAIAEAHALGIVHRDLKPANLFLARQPNGTVRVKVLDFGIARWRPRDAADAAVSTGAAPVGSPRYMAPEQLIAPASVGPAADLWALGVILFELLTGEAPFTGATLAKLDEAILHDAPPLLRFRRPDAPAALEDLVALCLVKEPECRIASVADYVVALRRAVPSSASHPEPALESTTLTPLGGDAAPSRSAATPSVVAGAAAQASRGRPNALVGLVGVAMVALLALAVTAGATVGVGRARHRDVRAKAVSARGGASVVGAPTRLAPPPPSVDVAPPTVRAPLPLAPLSSRRLTAPPGRTIANPPPPPPTEETGASLAAPPAPPRADLFDTRN